MKAFLLFQTNFGRVLTLQPACIVLADDNMTASKAVGGYYYYQKGQRRNVVVFPKTLFTPIKEGEFVGRLGYKVGSVQLVISTDEEEGILHIMELPLLQAEESEMTGKAKTG